MSVLRNILVMSLVAVMTACSSVTVITDYDKTVDFSKFKTYNVKRHDAPTGSVDPEKIRKKNLDLITSNIEEQMEKKGYVKSANPDLWISFYVKVDHKQELQTTSYGYYGGSPYYYGPYYGYNTGFTDVNVVEYTEGTLIVDMVEAKADLLIWQGVGKKTINENKIDHSDDIKKTIGEIFYRYRFSPAN